MVSNCSAFRAGGDLGQEISKRAKRKDYYTEEQLLNRFTDCAKAVNKMHENGVVHRDIKPQNIFLNKEGQAKLGDFGIAKSCSKNGRVQTPIGTPLYLDPQRVSNRSYGQKADMWGAFIVATRDSAHFNDQRERQNELWVT